MLVRTKFGWVQRLPSNAVKCHSDQSTFPKSVGTLSNIDTAKMTSTVKSVNMGGFQRRGSLQQRPLSVLASAKTCFKFTCGIIILSLGTYFGMKDSS